MDIQIVPGPPQNVTATQTTLTEVRLTWEPGLSLPTEIASYDVFFKRTTDPDYPAAPQITRYDSIPNYSEYIAVEPGIVYDFIVFTNTYTGLTSPEDCPSCHANNTLLCGNGVLDIGEICDTTQLSGAICEDFGYTGGTLQCATNCANYSFATCSTYTGGGGTVEEDTIPPTPGTAVSPEYASTSPFTVTYSGASDTGGSGLSYVELWYKKGTGGWVNPGITSTGSSGSFDFVPDSSLNATYYFDLRAVDNDGNTSATPSGSGDDSTIYDAQIPSIGLVTIPPTATALPIAISYANAIDTGISGLDRVELWYRQGESGTWTDSGLTSATASGSFGFNSATGSDNYYFDLIAVDKAGNRSTETQETIVPTAYDVDAPTLASVTVDASVTGGPITIQYTGAIDVGPAGFEHIELWRKREATGTWTNTGLSNTIEDGTFSFIPTALAGNYYFDFVLEDNFGNRSEAAAGDGVAVVAYTATPFAAVLSTLPPATTESRTASITVDGTNIIAYRFKLDTGDYENETPVATKIQLSDLALGTHDMSVIGKNNLGQWQATTSPTTYSWTIVAPPPAPTAVLSTLPPATTESRTASITVDGTDVTAYRFKLDAGTYGNEIPVANKINLANLAIGQHTLNVIGKSDLNVWQAESDSTTYSWTVLAPPPPPPGDVADEGEGDEEEEEAPSPDEGGQEEEEEAPSPDEGGQEEEEEAPSPDEGEGDEEEEEAPPETTTTYTSNGGDTGDEKVIEEEVVEEEAVEEEVIEEEPEEEVKPEITAPEPIVHYSAEEIQEKSKEVIKEKKVAKETVTTVALPQIPEQALSRIDECRLEYPLIPFGEKGTDSDNDGLSNKTECYAFTNPLLADTDGDECTDGDEINQFSSDPLNPLDCKPEEKERTISISSPQAGWLLAELEITGLTPEDTSLVNLLVFPVDEEGNAAEEAIELGSVNKFNPSGIEGMYHFRMEPEISLPDGKDYDLVAIGVLIDGATITSAPIRFSLDSENAALPPKPMFIGNVAITEELRLANIKIKTNENNKVEVSGETEYGTQVFAVWESIVLASSVIADSTLGTFSIESPGELAAGENHKVTLYAVKEQEGKKLRSKNVEIKFYIEKPGDESTAVTLIVFLSLLALLASILSLKFFRAGKKKKITKL